MESENTILLSKEIPFGDKSEYDVAAAIMARSVFVESKMLRRFQSFYEKTGDRIVAATLASTPKVESKVMRDYNGFVEKERLSPRVAALLASSLCDNRKMLASMKRLRKRIVE